MSDDDFDDLDFFEVEPMGVWRGETPCKSNSHPPATVGAVLRDEFVQLKMLRLFADFWACQICGGFLIRDNEGFRALTHAEYGRLRAEVQRKLHGSD